MGALTTVNTLLLFWSILVVNTRTQATMPSYELLWEATSLGGPDNINRLLEVMCEDSNSDNELSLHFAARSNLTELVLVTLSCNLMYSNLHIYNYTSVMLASEFNNTNFIDDLIRSGAEVSLRNEYGDQTASIRVVKVNLKSDEYDGITALMMATKYHNPHIIHTLIRKGAEVNQMDNNYQTALMWAIAYTRNLGVIRALVAEGAEVNRQDKDGKTALMLASTTRNPDIVHTLITAGAEVNLEDYNGDTPLMCASMEYNNSDTIHALIKAGAEVNRRNNKGKTALMWASIEYNNSDTIHTLLTAGAEVNLKDNDGRTALMWASPYNNTDNIRALITAGAEVNLKDSRGNNAFMEASKYNNLVILHVLTTAGAETNIKNEFGETALLLASRGNSPDTLNALIASGADVNLKNVEGMTALMLASMNNYPNITNSLILAGAEVNLKDIHGYTALHHATMNNNIEQVKVLLHHCANATIITDWDHNAAAIARIQGFVDILQMIEQYIEINNCIAPGSNKVVTSPNHCACLCYGSMMYLTSMIDG